MSRCEAYALGHGTRGDEFDAGEQQGEHVVVGAGRHRVRAGLGLEPDALAAAASATGATAAELDARIAQLQPRQFLLHSVHRPQPTVFKSRDALTVP
ncbi:MAG: hypothetical protein INH41_12565 [Myxococcaceae bacterium]|jgi:hypothetical protein|nr:hypothetical protein [Myxococcaceae bacterium]MCA3013219.1 hypothetical protein [Myxococcaceae bacterium]